MIEQKISIERMEEAINVFGSFDENVRLIESELHVTLTNRDGELKIAGEAEDVELAGRALKALLALSAKGEPIHEQNVRYVIGLARSGQEDKAAELTQDVVCITAKGRPVKAKTIGQKRYIDAIRANTVTFCLGPAGTGKTYLAMAMAVGALKRHEVSRIVLTRPVVEAGESLGFLPGTLQEKIDPYVRPLFDALFDMTDMERAGELVEQGIIEIAPLAYMRGRTLNDAFVVLDEAQNTTPEQMKMFLTRLGFNSKFIVTGDMTQRDLVGRRGGLTDIEEILDGVRDVAFIHLDRTDVVRHALVGRIVEAYDAFEARRDETAPRKKRAANHQGKEERT